MKENERNITTSIPKELWDNLKQHSRDTQWPMTKWITKFINEGLDKEMKKMARRKVKVKK